MINIIEEYKQEIERQRTSAEIYRELLIDQVQFSRNIPREKAAALADLEAFQKLQRVGLAS